MRRGNFFFLSLFLLIGSIRGQAQGDLNDLLNENIEDAESLISGYISPFMKSVSIGMNQGWYNTAKTHKVAGFDLTITGTAMMIPTSDLFYDVSKLNLSTVEMAPNSPDFPNAPTIFGPDTPPIYREVADPSNTFEGPGGIDLKGELGKNWMPVPMVSLGFGLPKGFDIKFRFLPKIDMGDDANIKMFGVGVMHDIKQYIPGLKLIPIDLAAFVGFTKLNLDYTYTPDAGDVTSNNQRGEFNLYATTIQGIVSKKISVLTVYGSLGYNISKSDIGLKGEWDVNDDGVIQPQEVDPISLQFSASGFRASAGFRLKFAFFTLHSDYTFQKYNALTIGFGINVR
ncbi:MAG: hypothetical protein JNM57_09425 [Cyclobacteriaceae bacterium]|nr:hypothetical protein [Cyclobacteriaceae bacterium]